METDFEYLLNAMECASAEQNPAEHDYRAKRTAVLAHVSALEAERDQLRAEYAAYGVDMGRALDEVSRLRAELREALTDTAAWALLNGIATGHADTLADLLAEITHAITGMRTKNTDLRAVLTEFATQYACGCGHRYCKPCKRDAEAREVLGMDAD